VPPLPWKVIEPEYVFENIPHGSKIQLGSFSHELFVRTEARNIILSENIHWAHGSTFEVFRKPKNPHCFQLRSMYHHWLRLDYETGLVLTDALIRLEATFFSAVSYNTTSASFLQNKFLNLTDRDSFSHVRLKVCDKDLWIDVRQASTRSIDYNEMLHDKTYNPIFAGRLRRNLTLALNSKSMRNSNGRISSSSWFTTTLLSTFRNSLNVFDYLQNEKTDNNNIVNAADILDSEVLSYSILKPILGVNLGLI
jgi:hypothetical protein